MTDDLDKLTDAELPERCGGYAEGEAKTFPRAACLALLRAKRAEKGNQ